MDGPTCRSALRKPRDKQGASSGGAEGRFEERGAKVRKVNEMRTMQEPKWRSGVWSLSDEPQDSQELQAHMVSGL